MPVKVNAIDHIVINVSDVARSAGWYAKILGMEIRVFDPGDGPTRKQGARGTLLSVYCRDPDGSLIEISSYEK